MYPARTGRVDDGSVADGRAPSAEGEPHFGLPEMQKIFRAMKRYGLIVADNGSDLYVSGTYDTRCRGVLNPAFGALKASDFGGDRAGYQSLAPAAPTNLRVVPE